MLEWIWKKCNGRELFSYCNACFYVILGLFIFILIGITFWTFSRPTYGSPTDELEYENSNYYTKKSLSVIDIKPRNGYIVKEGLYHIHILSDFCIIYQIRLLMNPFI